MNNKLKKLIVGLIVAVSATIAGYFNIEVQPETIEPIINVIADVITTAAQ